MGRLFFCLVLLLLVSFAIFFLLPDEDEFEGIDGPSSSTKKAGKKKHKKLSKEELYDAFIDTPEKEAPSVMMQARSQKNWADTDWEDPYVEFVDENEILDRIRDVAENEPMHIANSLSYFSQLGIPPIPLVTGEPGALNNLAAKIIQGLKEVQKSTNFLSVSIIIGMSFMIRRRL